MPLYKQSQFRFKIFNKTLQVISNNSTVSKLSSVLSFFFLWSFRVNLLFTQCDALCWFPLCLPIFHCTHIHSHKPRKVNLVSFFSLLFSSCLFCDILYSCPSSIHLSICPFQAGERLHAKDNQLLRRLIDHMPSVLL